MMSMFAGSPILLMTVDIMCKDVGTPIPALAQWRAVRRAPALVRR
jgi:hypothetical protein